MSTTLSAYKTKRTYRDESRTALRHAAMAAASLAAGIEVTSISIIPDNQGGGKVTQKLQPGQPDPSIRVDLMVMCSGPVAEQRVSGIDVTMQTDVVFNNGNDIEALLMKLPKNKRDQALNAALTLAERVVNDNWGLIKQFKQELMSHGQIDQDEIGFCVKYWKLTKIDE